MEGFSSMATKEEMMKVIQALPLDASVEDAIDSLYLLARIELGLEQADAGQTVSQEEARQRLAQWLR
jgi:predicted transcriptional regulator